MTDWSRRDVLKLGGVVSSVALAGCSSLDGSGDGTGGEFTAVPADAELLVSLDVSRILADEELRGRIEQTMGDSAAMGGGPTSVAEILDGIRTEFGLDPRGISGLLVFGRGVENGIQEVEGDGDPVFGLVADAEWTESDVKAALEDESESVEEASHSGQSLYRIADLAVGVLPDGRYVLGIPDVVRESIDVAGGDADAVSGELVDAFESARSGYVRTAFELSLEFTEDGAASAPVDTSQFEAIQSGYGAMYREESERGAEFTLEFADADAAGSVAQFLQSSRALAASQAANSELSSQLDGDVSALLDATSVEQDETTVTVTNTDGQGLLVVIPLAVVGSFVLGLGGSTQDPRPTAAFDFDYGSDGTLTITHEAGDAIPARELYVQGPGVTETGQWHTLADDKNADETVVAGDRITVDADSDYEARIVWSSQDGDSSAVLAEARGPDA